jgi:hypothetical protein
MIDGFQCVLIGEGVFRSVKDFRFEICFVRLGLFVLARRRCLRLVRDSGIGVGKTLMRRESDWLSLAVVLDLNANSKV